MREEINIDEYELKNYQSEIKQNPYGFGFPDDHPDLVNEAFDQGVDSLKKIFKFIPYAVLSFSLFFNPVYAGSLETYMPKKEILRIEEMKPKSFSDLKFNNLDAIFEKTPMEDFRDKHKKLEKRL